MRWNEIKKNTSVNIGCAASLINRKPIFAVWLVTHRCNLKCKFCHFWSRPVEIDKEIRGKDLRIVSEKLKRMGVRAVNLAGGEPAIRKDLPAIIKALSSDHIVIINSNGTLINREKADEIWKAGCDIVNISIEFPNEILHDQFRGKGVFKKAISSIECLLSTKTKKRQKIALQTILCPDNMNIFEELVKIADYYKIDFCFNPYRPGESEVDFSLFEKFDSKVLSDLKKKYNVMKATSYAIQATNEYIMNKGHYGKCGAGSMMLAIDPYGSVLPCEAKIDARVGNILEDDEKYLIKQLNVWNKQSLCNGCLCRERTEVEPLYSFGGLEWFRNLLYVRK